VRDYVRAAILAFAAEQQTIAETVLRHSHTLCPTLFTSSSLIEEWVDKYTPRHSTEAGITFIHSIFLHLFPKTAHLIRAKHRLLSKFHMQEVFIGIDTHQPARVDQHLWLGVRNDPSWLLNRGVLSQVVKRFARAWRA
jgi:hypothetical protein